MLTINQITENKEAAIKGLEKKHFPQAAECIEQAISYNEKRKAAQTELDKNLAEQNKTAKTIGLLMKDLNKRLADREVSVALSNEAEAYITEHGYDPVYGARPLKRYLQKTVETLAAKLILADEVHAGDTILIDVVEGTLKAYATQTA